MRLGLGALKLQPEVFWNMTLAELSLAAEGHNEAQKLWQRQMITASWTTAALIRSEKMPDLSELLEPEAAPTIKPDSSWFKQMLIRTGLKSEC